MFPCSSFSLSTLLYVLSYSVYQASIPSTDVSRRWEAPVPAVVFDYRVQDTNEDLDLSEDNTITPGVISGLLEPIVLVHTNLDHQTRLSNDVAITVEDTPSQGIIRQLLEPAIIETVSAVIVVQTPVATTPIDDAPRSASAPHQSTRLSLRVARAQSNLRTFKSLALSAFLVVVASLVMVFKQASRSFYHRFFQSIPIPTSRSWRSSFLGQSTQMSVFIIITMVLISFAMGFLARSVSFEKLSAVLDTLHFPLFVDLCSFFGTMASCGIESAVTRIVEARLGVGFRQGQMVAEDIPLSEQADSEHGGNLEASIDSASLPSGSVCSDAVQPSRTSVSIQAMPEVNEVKNVSVGTEPVSKTSVGVQCSLAPKESTNVFAPAESRRSLYVTATDGNLPSQMMDDPESFSVPTVSSEYNIYTMAETMPFPSVDDLRKSTDFERLREDVRGFGYESEGDGRATVTEHGTVPSCDGARSIAIALNLPLDRLLQDQFGSNPWNISVSVGGRIRKAREFWYRMLRSEELIRVVYDTMFPLNEAATDEDKYEMELGERLVRISALRLSEHATNPILRLPYNALTEDVDHKDSLLVSTEANPTIQTGVSSAASIDIRSPSLFVRPSNPQSRFLESSSEASVAGPAIQYGIPSPSRTPAVYRRRPALAQVTNTPHTLETAPLSRTPIKVGRVQGVRYGVPTPPSSARPKLAKHGSRFPLIAPPTRIKDESDSPTRPAHRSLPAFKFHRWRG
ncbi:hypothetical protein ARMGADRAFT_1073867 [Armillaria gallica]|uniref:Uncharacterized protein n=1 Tax=Armillaria gallica TaxID=47427 RepID=A0A2H3E5F1_ARMGA|nr:hypothetical protein ARMGADRAFT_1073867 [Armillaria gallica]